MSVVCLSTLSRSTVFCYGAAGSGFSAGRGLLVSADGGGRVWVGVHFWESFERGVA